MTQQGSAFLSRPYHMHGTLTLPSSWMNSSNGCYRTPRGRKPLPRQNICVANVPHHAYQLDLMFIQHPEDQEYDTALACVEAFSKYAAVTPIKGKAENHVALGIIESIVKIGQPPKTMYTDSEIGIRNSRLFQKYFNENKLTAITPEGTLPLRCVL